MAENLILTGPDGTEYTFPGVSKVSIRKDGGGRVQYGESGGGNEQYIAMINRTIESVSAADIRAAGGLSPFSFAGSTLLTSVSIPTDINIDTIPTYCFYNCILLDAIDMPQEVYSIEDSAFEFSGLSSVDLANVTNIGTNAFAYTQLNDPVDIADGTLVLGGAFMGARLSQGISVGHGCVIVPDGTFSQCEFTTFTMPVDSYLCNWFLTDSPGLFSLCRYLQSVDVTLDSGEVLGVDVKAHAWFMGCSELRSITIRSDYVPEADADTFGPGIYSAVPSNCIIYVRPAMVAAFQAADYWKNYNIQAIPTT